MTNNNYSPSTLYYVSPNGKIHADTCRYCQANKEGWQLLKSFSDGINNNYEFCRLCCPWKVLTEDTSSPPLKIMVTSDSTPTTSQKIKTLETMIDSSSISEEKLPKEESSSPPTATVTAKKSKLPPQTAKKTKPKENPEKKRYKILAGNGCHQAIAEVQGILVPPTTEDGMFMMILPDGFQVEVTFKTPRIRWIAYNQDTILGAHWFRVYPKMKDDKLISLQIVAWDKGMPTNPHGNELWEFIGVWTAQKNLTVQRSMMTEDIRQIAKETGFIKKFKYTFINSADWAKNKKLWTGYVYKLICQRKGDVLEIKKVIPYACPRIKPALKSFNKGGDKPPFKKDFHKKK